MKRESRMTIDHGIIIAAEKPNTPEVRRLLAERDAYFDRLYAKEDRHAKPVDVEREEVEFFSVRASDRLVGCGALLWRETYGELKRFYISEAYRGRGFGRKLLEVVEKHARYRGCRILRLETGILQPAAITLYRSTGFNEITCFSGYVPDPLSIFLEKTL
jgi:putative acetyltransferase